MTAATASGYNVSVVQNPTLSLEDDAAVTRRVIDAQGARDVRRAGATVEEVGASHSLYVSQPSFFRRP
jgi:hypothetical protein